MVLNRFQVSGVIGVCAAGWLLGAGGTSLALCAPKTLPSLPDQPLPVQYHPEDFETIGELYTVAGTTPGSQVYRNTSGAPSVYLPGKNQRMADDMTLACGECEVVFYDLVVIGGVHPSLPNLPFDVTVELWDGDPCLPGSAIIPGSQEVFSAVPADGSPRLLSITLDVPAAAPSTVWMAVTFSEADAGWLVAAQAEAGSTLNSWSENDTQGCGLYVLNSGTHAGFWASINCTFPSPPLGACCTLSTCSQATEAECAAGVWQGPCSSCSPNPCQSGTCCTGSAFNTCASATEATCPDGVFTPDATCAEGCRSNFKIFENDFQTGLFIGVLENTKFADDLTFAPGTPCDLLAYDLLVFGDPTDAPPTFDVTLSLWSNDDNGTPGIPEDDLPGEQIPGTDRLFNAIPADFAGHRLLASGFSDIVLPTRAWVVIETSSPNGGPGLAGLADVGESLDAFAIFNPTIPEVPNEWVGGFWFEGFNPEGCPGGQTCNPAGSFRANVWCAGNPPTGACCDRFSGSCTEGVTFPDCNGRWVEGGTCAPGTFNPSCGTHACCERFELNPNATICVDRTAEECATRIDGFLSRGKFCEDFDGECPAAMCMGNEGDCLAEHAGVGCEDPFCTCAVCNTTTGAFCCSVLWDDICAVDAVSLCPDLSNNDLCIFAKEITGVGFFEFDNTNAGTDGLAHVACPSESGNGIARDVWFKWTATCTATVFVSTCDQTFIDSKIAVYNGTNCTPTDEMLAACNDNRCLGQSLVTFSATQGQEYLIRIGSAPSQGSGTGTFRITCGPPPNAACPNTGDCCAGNGTPGCSDSTCCRTVCACDAFCCTTEWDEACATIGFEGNTCGAAVMCTNTCAGGCPPGPVDDVTPPSGVVDAGRPFNSITGTPIEGVSSVQLVAPSPATDACFDFCETVASGGANDIADVLNMGGLYELTLLRPMTAGAASTITYSNILGGSTSGLYISHPGNANGDDITNADDVTALIGALMGEGSVPWNLFSSDIDRSGRFTPLDLWEEMNLLNGAEAQTIWDNTLLPEFTGICP